LRLFTTAGIESKAPHRSTYFADGSYYLISLSFDAVEGGLSGAVVFVRRDLKREEKADDSTRLDSMRLTDAMNTRADKDSGALSGPGLWVMLASFVRNQQRILANHR
jgi:hypothetical protein